MAARARVNVRVIDRDRGFKKLLARLGERYTLTVGVHPEDGSETYDNGATLADIATIHEFGLGNNPERSFMRSTLDEERPEIAEIMRKVGRAVVAGKMAPALAHQVVGEDIVRRIQGTIRGRIPPPLSDRRLAQKERAGKSGDVPLIDEGRLINSIRQRVRRTA